MSQNRIVTLLSDFGLQDVYVGVMKGVIATINPQLQVVDLTHQIPPQSLAAGRFSLLNACPYFPTGTVHVGVVDPGVGSQRRCVAVAFPRGFLVGPDNGLFSGILSLSPAVAAVELTNTAYWRVPHPSATFHGRDIFSPVAAHLAKGVALEALGERIDVESLVKLPIPESHPTNVGIAGYIQYIDYFGNLVTNIPAEAVAGKTWSVAVGNVVIPVGQTYSDTQTGELVALIGSHGWVEIAVNCGSAQSQLQVDWGGSVEVVLSKTNVR